MNAMSISYGFYESPFGRCIIAVMGEAVCYLAFVDTKDAEAMRELREQIKHETYREDAALIAKMGAAIFGGTQPKLQFSGTPFQMNVWRALCNIPAGKTVSYHDVAQQIGKPKAVRAVANAVGANPISYLIPCHRVIRKSGALGGYRWGLEKKRALLQYEKF